MTDPGSSFRSIPGITDLEADSLASRYPNGKAELWDEIVKNEGNALHAIASATSIEAMRVAELLVADLGQIATPTLVNRFRTHLADAGVVICLALIFLAMVWARTY